MRITTMVLGLTYTVLPQWYWIHHCTTNVLNFAKQIVKIYLGWKMLLEMHRQQTCGALKCCVLVSISRFPPIQLYAPLILGNSFACTRRTKIFSAPNMKRFPRRSLIWIYPNKKRSVNLTRKVNCSFHLPKRKQLHRKSRPVTEGLKKWRSNVRVDYRTSNGSLTRALRIEKTQLSPFQKASLTCS
jgi:hypothetical protein